MKRNRSGITLPLPLRFSAGLNQRADARSHRIHRERRDQVTAPAALAASSCRRSVIGPGGGGRSSTRDPDIHRGPGECTQVEHGALTVDQSLEGNGLIPPKQPGSDGAQTVPHRCRHSVSLAFGSVSARMKPRHRLRAGTSLTWRNSSSSSLS